MKFLFTILPVFAATGANALFDCQSDQHAFDPTTGKFVVHYTSIRDTEYDGEPWVRQNLLNQEYKIIILTIIKIRICKPSGNGWEEVDPLTMDCVYDSYTFKTERTGLRNPLIVFNGNGCDSDSSNLDDASIRYGDQDVSLDGSDDNCGSRDHGISCQFDL